MSALTQKSRQLFKSIRQFIKKNSLDPLPIRHTIKAYNRQKASSDLKAALNVSLLALPQGMAYAAVAGLPIYYGIIAAGLAAIVAPFFASSQFTIQGPTNNTAFMVFSFFAAADPNVRENIMLYMPLLIFMVGIISVFGALLKIADLLQYVSRSVLVGYITGAALMIMNGQLKHIFGVADHLHARTFLASLRELASSWQYFQASPLILGTATLILYLTLNKFFPKLPNFALTLIISTLAALALTRYVPGFHVETFLPLKTDQLTPSLPYFDSHNVSMLFGIAFAVAFLANLENSIMAKNLGSRTGHRPDVNQDMFAVGIANLACSVIAPVPSSGSLTRSALNYEAGAKTCIASIYCGLICLAGFGVLAAFPIVENIPKPSLAALVIGIAISLIKWKNIRICLRSTNDDAIVVIVTFLATLLTRLDNAIFIGVGISIALFLRRASIPNLVEYEINDEGDLRELGKKKERQNPAISIVHVEGDLYFGAADLFRDQVQHAASDPNIKVIILRMRNARHLDATSVLALEELVKHMRKQGKHVLISGATRPVYKVLKQSGVLQTILDGCDRKNGETNLFFTSPSNPNLSTRDALLRAQELLGTKDAEIKIFFDPSQKKK